MKRTIEINIDKLRQELQAETCKYQMHREWLPWEDDLIREFSREGNCLPAHVLAEKLKRTKPQVDRRRESLGIRLGKRLVYPVKK